MCDIQSFRDSDRQEDRMSSEERAVEMLRTTNAYVDPQWPYVSLTQPPYFPASPSIGLDLADADLSCARCNTLGIILTSQVRTVLQQNA